jgi:hypothetical protein
MIKKVQIQQNQIKMVNMYLSMFNECYKLIKKFKLGKN